MKNADNSLPPPGSTLQQAFRALITTFDQRGIAYAIIGGIATIQHTRVRTTMRPQAETDVQDLIAAYAGGLDVEYVRTELRTLMATDDPRLAKFEVWLGQVDPGNP